MHKIVTVSLWWVEAVAAAAAASPTLWPRSGLRIGLLRDRSLEGYLCHTRQCMRVCEVMVWWVCWPVRGDRARRSAASITSSLHTSTGAQTRRCSNMSPKLVSERVKKTVRATTIRNGRPWLWRGVVCEEYTMSRVRTTMALHSAHACTALKFSEVPIIICSAV